LSDSVDRIAQEFIIFGVVEAGVSRNAGNVVQSLEQLERNKMMEIKKVGVMGCGAMGLGVAQVCAQAGIPTVAVKATPGSTDKIRSGWINRWARWSSAAR
jgi:phosphoglycerate dehydrogenase-like enzyme